MNGKKWTEDEEIYLEYYLFDGEMKDYKAAEEFLRRSNRSISAKVTDMKKQGVPINNFKRRWTEEEVVFLKRHYSILKPKNIAHRLNRTTAAVQEKARLLGISKESRPRHKDAEIRWLAERGLTRREIAHQTGMSYDSIRNYVFYNNIEVKPVSINERIRFMRKYQNSLFIK